MKILNEEKENDKIYVQINDILFLASLEINLPKTINKKRLNELKLSAKDNEATFIEFTNNEEIEFLKNIKYIIDYNEYINLSIEELEEKAQQIFDQIIIINDNNKESYKVKKHMIKDLVEIYKIKQETSSIELPQNTSKTYKRLSKKETF